MTSSYDLDPQEEKSDAGPSMTESQYMEWAKSVKAWKPYLIEPFVNFTERTILMEFALINQSDVVSKNFLKLDLFFQTCIEDFARDGIDLSTLEEFTRLAALVQKLNLDVDFSTIETRSGSVTFLWDLMSRLVTDTVYEELEQLSHECVMLYRYDDYPTVAEPTVLMLCLVYGVDCVLEILREWVRIEDPGTVSELIAVTRDWETVKGYPISWAISLSRGDISE